MSPTKDQIRRRRERSHELLRLLADVPLMRGSLVQRFRRCGRTNCACALDPEARHPGLFLTVHLDGATRSVHVRPEDEPQLREAIDGYTRLWEVLNEMTRCEFDELQRASRERRKARGKAKR